MGKPRVLLADDHTQFLTMVRTLLSPTCEIIGTEPDGQSLFDGAQELMPDVIVTDISMPILNGLEASKRLNESGCKAKIIFLTAHSDADFVRSCLAVGALGYVEKSRLMIDLIPAIKEALAGRIFISVPFSHKAWS